MKIHLKKFVLGQVTLMFALACFALAPLIHAQCPQICDDNMNTALGDDALVNNTSGTGDTAIGASALTSNTTAFSNTATGSRALLSNTEGGDNTATGVTALRSDTVGSNNSADGSHALFNTTTGNDNTAAGDHALFNNTSGSSNTGRSESQSCADSIPSQCIYGEVGRAAIKSRIKMLNWNLRLAFAANCLDCLERPLQNSA